MARLHHNTLLGEQFARQFLTLEGHFSTGQDAIEPSLLKALAQARLDGVLSADPGEGSGN